MSDISINNKTVKKVLVGDKVLYEKQSDPVTALPMALPVTEIDDADIIMKNGQPFRDSGQKLKVTPNIKIVDANFQSWTVKDWHAAARARNFDKSCAAPIGFELNAWGKHFIFYMRSKYMDAAGASKTYYDVTGTTAITNGGLRHSAWNHTMDTFANGATRTYTIGDSSVVATSTADGENVILSTSNSPFTWTIKKGLVCKNVFEDDNAKERFDALIAYTEWYRTLAAKDLGVVSEQQIAEWKLFDDENKPKFVDIFVFNEQGTGRPAATEDMYFFVKDYTNNQYVSLNTQAKYNATGNSAASGILGGDNLTSAIADSIYAAQKANGVNMNDNAANIAGVENGKVILTEGCKGSQVYVHNVAAEGETPVYHLFLVTPIISRANNGTTQLVSVDYNIPDSPAISWVKWYNAQYSGQNVPVMFMPDERMLQAVKNNRPTCLNSLLNYLNSSNGEAWGVHGFPSEYAWSVVRYSAAYSWYVYLVNGYVSNFITCGRYVSCAASAL